MYPHIYICISLYVYMCMRIYMHTRIGSTSPWMLLETIAIHPLYRTRKCCRWQIYENIFINERCVTTHQPEVDIGERASSIKNSLFRIFFQAMQGFTQRHERPLRRLGYGAVKPESLIAVLRILPRVNPMSRSSGYWLGLKVPWAPK